MSMCELAIIAATVIWMVIAAVHIVVDTRRVRKLFDKDKVRNVYIKMGGEWVKFSRGEKQDEQ